MLHTKFRGNRSTGLEKKIFKEFLHFFYIFLYGNKRFEHCERRTTTDAGPWVYYKLTYEPLAQVS